MPQGERRENGKPVSPEQIHFTARFMHTYQLLQSNSTDIENNWTNNKNKNAAFKPACHITLMHIVEPLISEINHKLYTYKSSFHHIL